MDIKLDGIRRTYFDTVVRRGYRGTEYVVFREIVKPERN